VHGTGRVADGLGAFRHGFLVVEALSRSGAGPWGRIRFPRAAGNERESRGFAGLQAPEITRLFEPEAST
jgi:hypothetical protein